MADNSSWWVHCLQCTNTGLKSGILQVELHNKSHLNAQFCLDPSFEVHREDQECWLAAHLRNHDKRQEEFDPKPPPQITALYNQETCTVVRGDIYILPLCQKHMNLSLMTNQKCGAGWNSMAEVTQWDYSLSDHICCPCHPIKNLGTNFKIPSLPGRKRTLHLFPWGHP